MKPVSYIATLTGISIFVIDQLSKFIVVHVMDLKAIGSIDVWAPYINFRMGWNRGINFGLFQENGDVWRVFLIAIAIGISAWVVWWMRREKPGPWARASAGLLVGGAMGNVIDRINYGAVADFLNMSCCGFSNPYSFNIADISIFAGAIGLIFLTSGDGRDAREDSR